MSRINPVQESAVFGGILGIVGLVMIAKGLLGHSVNQIIGGSIPLLLAFALLSPALFSAMEKGQEAWKKRQAQTQAKTTADMTELCIFKQKMKNPV